MSIAPNLDDIMGDILDKYYPKERTVFRTAILNAMEETYNLGFSDGIDYHIETESWNEDLDIEEIP